MGEPTLFDGYDVEPVVNSLSDMDGLRRLLSPEQIDLLMSVLVDHQTQHEIARALDRPQSTVASRVCSVRDILRSVGLDVPFPSRGRPRSVSGHRLALVDPADMDRLTVREDEQGVLFGAWVDSN